VPLAERIDINLKYPNSMNAAMNTRRSTS